MCKRHFYKFALLLSLAFFAAQAVAEGSRIAFVNISKLIEKSAPALEANKRLKSEFAPRSKKLIAKQKEIRAIDAKLNSSDRSIMSAEQVSKLQAKKRTLIRALKRDKVEYREDLSLRQNQELKKVQKKVYDAIVKLAKQEKYDMVLSVGVIYKSDAIDITNKVIASLKK